MTSFAPSGDEASTGNDSHLKHDTEDPNAEFGGAEARRVLERKLLRKIDLRMSILVVIYILNYVRFLLLYCGLHLKIHFTPCRLTAIMQG
jgi:hypothetical protein